MAISAETPYSLSANSRARFLDQPIGKALVVAVLFATMLLWCSIRSYYVDGGRGDQNDSVVPLAIRFSVMAAFFVPTLVIAWDGRHVAWLVGVSGAIGSLPNLPLVPFLRDYAHLAILFWCLLLLVRFLRKPWPVHVPLFMKFLCLYLAVAVFSVGANFLLFQNIWQIKVGIVFLLIVVPFSIVLGALANAVGEADFDALLDGVAWGVFGQTVVALVAIPLVLYLPFTEGNDTIFGLAYYDRYKSTFSGPVSLGMYFLIAIPLLLIWSHRAGHVSWATNAYLQLAPWLIMATGSRTARVVAVGTFALLLGLPKARRAMLLILPSAILAYWICFKYQSLPASIVVLAHQNADPSRDLSDRFFDVTDRVDLVKATISSMTDSNFFVNLFGFGAGVGGYRTSGFPAPHNMLMTQWVETGIFGVLALGGFLVALCWSILRYTRESDTTAFAAFLMLTALASFGVVNAAYATTYWGYTFILLFLAVSMVRMFEISPLSALARQPIQSSENLVET